jgi:hypothetical protein
MSRRANVILTVGWFCAVHKIAVDVATEFAYEVLEDAGQMDVDTDDEKEVAQEKVEIKYQLDEIYSRVDVK